MSNHDQLRELIQGYALGALDAQEREALEAHLASGCGECSKALEEARWLVSQLAYLAPGAEPSELLKGRLLQTVRAEAGGGTTPPAAVRGAAVPWWMWAGVAALLLFSAYSAWNVQRLQNEIGTLREQAETQKKERAKLEQEMVAAKVQAHEAMI